MTLKDSQRLAVIPKDPETRMTAKDRQQHSTTGCYRTKDNLLYIVLRSLWSLKIVKEKRQLVQFQARPTLDIGMKGSGDQGRELGSTVGVALLEECSDGLRAGCCLRS